MPKIAVPESITTHNTRRRPHRATVALFAASLLLTACTHGKGSHNTTATSAGSPSSSKKPSASAPKNPGPNPKHDSRHLLQCLDGNLALPATPDIDKDLSLEINKQGNLTAKTLSATGRTALKAATVEVHDELDPTHRIIGSGVIIDGMIFTAAHVVADRTIDHITFLLNGEKYQKMGMHKLKGGCYIYQHNGEQAKLDLHSLDKQFTITDDVAVLVPQDPVGTGLQLASAPPSRGEVIYSGGVKYPQDQHPWEVVSAIALEPRSQHNDALALSSGKANDNFDYGDSGSSMVNAGAAVLGIVDSSARQNAMFLNINYGAGTSEPLQQIDYTPLSVLQAAAAAVTK